MFDTSKFFGWVAVIGFILFVTELCAGKFTVFSAFNLFCVVMNTITYYQLKSEGK